MPAMLSLAVSIHRRLQGLDLGVPPLGVSPSGGDFEITSDSDFIITSDGDSIIYVDA